MSTLATRLVTMNHLAQIRGATLLAEKFLAQGDDAEFQRELIAIERQIKSVRRDHPRPTNQARCTRAN